MMQLKKMTAKDAKNMLVEFQKAPTRPGEDQELPWFERGKLLENFRKNSSIDQFFAAQRVEWSFNEHPLISIGDWQGIFSNSPVTTYPHDLTAPAKIVMLPPDHFRRSDWYYRVALHELAHATRRYPGVVPVWRAGANWSNLNLNSEEAVADLASVWIGDQFKLDPFPIELMRQRFSGYGTLRASVPTAAAEAANLLIEKGNE